MSATEAHEHSPFIDYENIPAPKDGILVTHFMIVRSVARSRAFYSEVLGGQVVLEENPCVVKLANSWVLMNPGGPPTPDKPDISAVNYEPGNTVSTFMNLRVADIQACYEQWSANGAEFITPPIDRGAEIRCYMRDPDGYLIEVGQATGVLRGSSPRSDLKTCPAKSDRTTKRAEPTALGRTAEIDHLGSPSPRPPMMAMIARCLATRGHR
jgi:catechol 2,3-dioxygenase-like lactoylglutathione lyase family enzyme